MAVCRRSLVSFLLLLLNVLISTRLNAQRTNTGVWGLVQDTGQKGIAGAVVRIENEDTHFSRSTATNGTGQFLVDGLPIGKYRLEVSHQGFRTAQSDEFELLIGQMRRVNFTLQLPNRAEVLNVQATSSEVDVGSAAIGSFIARRQLNGLPVNGRNWTTLLPLMPGATDPGSSDQRSVRFAGHGRDDNNITYDGVDATGISNQPQKTGIRLAIPISGASEFRVDSTAYDAASADGTGGQISLASVGGTNAFHGAAFEFLRNDIFDARNPFASSNPPFRLNEFGANFGGPVIRDRTFFFVAFEGSRQRLDQALQGFTPSAAYRNTVLAQSPSLAPLLNAYPAGNVSQPQNPSIDLFIGLSPQRVDETSGMVRLDHRFSSRVSTFLRVNVDEQVSDTPLNNLRDRQVVDNRPINGAFSVSQTPTPAMLNEIKAGFNQVFSRTAYQTPFPYTVSISGFTGLSGAQTRQEDDTSASLIDNFFWVHGRHTLRVGAEGRRVMMNPGSSATGTLSFTNLTALAQNQLNTASVTSELPMKRLRKTQAFGFVMDEFRALPTLTLNFGLRYQFFNVFHETDGRAVPFDFATCGGFCPPGAQFSTPRTNDFDPRIGIAWAPSAFQNKTVLRAGFGIYHGDGQLEDQNLPASNDQARYSLSTSQFPGLSYPIAPYLASAPGILSPRAQNRNRKDEYSAQWGFSLDQQLPLQIAGSLSYMGNKGTDLQTITYTNLLDPVTGLRPYPQFGQLEYRTNDSNSTFHALIASARRRLAYGLLFGANYMWSHAINDGSLGGGEADIIQPQNPFCRACDRASSAQDLRHVFSANAIYDLPFGAGKRYLSTPGLARTLLGGWSLGGIATARTGLPVNVTISRPSSLSVSPYGYNVNLRPDLVPGVSLTPPGGSRPQQWINPVAFAMPANGTFGNAGRDIARGPALYQLDMGLAKQFAVSERSSLQFRWEVFNVFNRAQYGQPSGDVTVPSQFGVIQSTINTTPVGSGTPRQMQFMLRATF
jgi:Carboxypeptidase regulatory-like domain